MKWLALFTLVLASLLVVGCTASAGGTAGGSITTPTPQPTVAGTVSATPTPNGGSSVAAVTIQGFAFSPSSLTVKAGTTIRFTNMESTPHAVVFSSGVASDTLALGQHFDVTLNTAGTYAYHCGIHPDMTGTIIVTA